jgi:hypothetical protein
MCFVIYAFKNQVQVYNTLNAGPKYQALKILLQAGQLTVLAESRGNHHQLKDLTNSVDTEYNKI